MRRIAIASVLLALAVPGAAWAGHGKAGLWNISSTTNMAMTLPPEVQAQMKQMGMTAPTSHTVTSQMCMSQADVDSDEPPQIDRQATGCVTKILSATPAAMKAEMTCNGKMKGTGQIQVAYQGNEHYTGSYSFKGAVEGNPTSTTTSFKGDWIKADCGAVKPYKLR